MPRKTLPKFCTWNRDREDGRLRVRFRKHGFSTYLPGVPYSEKFNAAYHAALDGVKAKAEIGAGADRTKPGTISALIVHYYNSPEFRAMAPSTQRERRYIIERFRSEHGNKPVKLLERGHIKAILAQKAATPEAANTLLKCIRLLLNLAVDIEMIAASPAIGIKKFKSKGEGYHTWTEDELAAFEARHPLGIRARLALALMIYTAQRRSDVVRMGFQHVRGDKIAVRQQKTDTPLLIPIHAGLAQALATVSKGNLTFLLTDYGAPFTHAGFGNWFRDRCDEAALPQCTAHGLRKAAARRLAEAGCSDKQIAAVTGHKSMSEVARYTKAADQARLAEQAMSMLAGENKKTEILSSMATPLDKQKEKA